MTEPIQHHTQYTSLSAIQQRKAELLQEIRKDSKEINTLWHGLFSQPAANRKKGISVAGIVATGTGVIDGLLFAWKLYRKLKR